MTTVRGQPLRAAGLLSKSRELVGILSLQREGTRREAITEALFPDVDPDRVQDRFSAAISRLRCSVRSAAQCQTVDIVPRTDSLYRLDPALVDVDLWHLEDLLRSVDAVPVDADTRLVDMLRKAQLAYPGDFGAGEDWKWAEAVRESLRRSAFDVVLRAAIAEEILGHVEQALVCLEHALRIDPYAEDCHVRAVRLLVQAGRSDSARHVVDLLEKRLRELDVDASPSTRQQIRETLAQGTT